MEVTIIFGSSIHITERFHITMASNKRLFPALGASFFLTNLRHPNPLGSFGYTSVLLSRWLKGLRLHD